MGRRLLALNALLAVAALACAAYVVRVVTTPPPPPPPAPAPEAPTGSYAVVATRNLFSPTRSEAPVTVTPGGGVVAQLPRPYLYGVVLRDEAPIAYLEDPLTKRVAGYRVGDTVAGGTLTAIGADRVVLARPEGPIDVRLHDPTKPRQLPPPTAPTPPAAGTARPPGAPPAAAAPPAPVPGPPAAEEGVRPGPARESQLVPAGPGRRVFPPPLRRRIPPGTGEDATAQE